MLPEDKLLALRARYHDLTDLLCQPDVAADGARFTKFSRERGELLRDPPVLAGLGGEARLGELRLEAHGVLLEARDPVEQVGQGHLPRPTLRSSSTRGTRRWCRSP